jgi:hypothetical protein
MQDVCISSQASIYSYSESIQVVTLVPKSAGLIQEYCQDTLKGPFNHAARAEVGVPRHWYDTSAPPPENQKGSSALESKAKLELKRRESKGLERKGLVIEINESVQVCDRAESAPSNVCCEEETSTERLREGEESGMVQGGMGHTKFEGVIGRRRNSETEEEERQPFESKRETSGGEPECRQPPVATLGSATVSKGGTAECSGSRLGHDGQVVEDLPKCSLRETHGTSGEGTDWRDQRRTDEDTNVCGVEPSAVSLKHSGAEGLAGGLGLGSSEEDMAGEENLGRRESEGSGNGQSRVAGSASVAQEKDNSEGDSGALRQVGSQGS